MTSKKKAPPTGPRGGTTTRGPDGSWIKKAFLMGPEEAEALRTAAFVQVRSESDIVREAVRKYLELDVEESDSGDTVKEEESSES